MVQKTETTNDLSFYTEEQQKAMYFTETYTKRALSWLCLLQWPSEVEAGDAGVTYLELFLDSYLTSGCYPINIAWDGFGFPIYKLLDDCGRDPSLSMRPRPLHQTLRAFEYSLKYIHKMFGDDYFPCSKSGQTNLLIAPEKVLQLVTSDTPLNTLKVFSIDNAELPVQKPLFEIPVQSSDNERKAQSSYKRFRAMTWPAKFLYRSHLVSHVFLGAVTIRGSANGVKLQKQWKKPWLFRVFRGLYYPVRL